MRTNLLVQIDLFQSEQDGCQVAFVEKMGVLLDSLKLMLEGTFTVYLGYRYNLFNQREFTDPFCLFPLFLNFLLSW